MDISSTGSTRNRIRGTYAVIILVSGIFIARLFHLQIIKYTHYRAEATASQLRSYDIPAERGAIYAMDGNERVPLVLNELRYQIVADPEIITDKEETAYAVADILGVSKDEILAKLETKSRYEILAKKQTKDVKERIERAYSEGDIVGVFAEKTSQRVYPHGALAAQLLGFVNDDGKGNYGVEEFIDGQLAGEPGRVRALTDHNGVPLLASGDNILDDPVDGTEVTLSIDLAMQKQVEDLLKSGLEQARSESGSAIVMDPNSGQVVAMANYPSYDISKFTDVKDPALYANPAVSSPLEPGSVMKVLTAAAALDAGSVQAAQTYYDPSYFIIDGATVRNIEEDGGAATHSVSDILRLSLNTGATWLLMQMGGGELNEQGRKVWHDYMVNHYHFGANTGIEQGYEEPGLVPDPSEGFGLNIRYANTSFGQGITITPLQMAAAVSAVVNGGTYYQPTLIAGYTEPGGEFTPSEPKVVQDDVVSEEVSSTIVDFMQTVLQGNSVTRRYAREGYKIGGKTGTAEIANPAGGYYEDRFNGTYVGFVGGDKPQYVIMVRVNEPKIPGYAGAQAAGPLFGSIADMLIDNFSVTVLAP